MKQYFLSDQDEAFNLKELINKVNERNKQSKYDYEQALQLANYDKV